jgi:hypothetical protein
MVSSCDPTVRFWINAKQLKEEALWQAGWKTLHEINNPEPKEDYFFADN